MQLGTLAVAVLAPSDGNKVPQSHLRPSNLSCTGGLWSFETQDPSLGQGWLGVVYPFQLQSILGHPLLEMPSSHWASSPPCWAAQMLGWLLIAMGALHYNFSNV